MANHRLHKPQAATINGVSFGGLTVANIVKGYDQVLTSSPDGAEVAFSDRYCQYCRGNITTQDITQALNILTGDIDTFVFYEAESGESTYIKHTINNPVIFDLAISINKDQYATASFNFECLAESASAGFAGMHVPARAEETLPEYVAAARGGQIVKTLKLGTTDILHVTGLSFNLAFSISKESNDGSVGYTTIDTSMNGILPSGNISFQDSGAETDKDLSGQVLALTRQSLVATLAMGQGAADKTVTIAGVEIISCSNGSSSGDGYTTYDASYQVTNNATTPLTLSGTNKIITIA